MTTHALLYLGWTRWNLNFGTFQLTELGSYLGRAKIDTTTIVFVNFGENLVTIWGKLEQVNRQVKLEQRGAFKT